MFYAPDVVLMYSLSLVYYHKNSYYLVPGGGGGRGWGGAYLISGLINSKLIREGGLMVFFSSL